MIDSTRLLKMPSEEPFSPESEIRARFKLLGESGCLFQAMDTVLVEVISGTYPFLNIRQIKVLQYIIQVIWSIGFAQYIEVVYWLLQFEDKLFPSRKTIVETIRELRDMKIVESRITTLKAYDHDRKRCKVSRTRVLKVPENFRLEAIAAMSEVFCLTISSFFKP